MHKRKNFVKLSFFSQLFMRNKGKSYKKTRSFLKIFKNLKNFCKCNKNSWQFTPKSIWTMTRECLPKCSTPPPRITRSNHHKEGSYARWTIFSNCHKFFGKSSKNAFWSIKHLSIFINLLKCSLKITGNHHQL